MAPFSGSDLPTGSTGPASGFWEINLWTSGSYYNLPGANATYTGNRAMLSTYVSGTIPPFTIFDPSNPDSPYSGGGRFKAGDYFTAPFDGFYNFSGVFVFVKEDTDFPYTISGSFTLDIINGGTGSTTSILSSGFVDGAILATKTVNVTAGYSNYYDPGKEISLQTSAYLPSGSKVFFRLKTNYRAASYIAGSPKGIYIEPGANIVCTAVNLDATLCRSLSITANNLFDSSSFTTSSFTLTRSTNNFFTSASTFNPSYSDYYNSSSVLYGEFGDINYSMQPEAGDYIYLYYDGTGIGLPVIGNLRALRFRIITVDSNPTTNTQRFTVVPNISDYITPEKLNSYVKAVFTKRVPDETTLILEGRKNPGKTSYGFAIPENINPTILKNANTLQSTIQSQILNF